MDSRVSIAGKVFPAIRAAAPAEILALFKQGDGKRFLNRSQVRQSEFFQINQQGSGCIAVHHHNHIVIMGSTQNLRWIVFQLTNIDGLHDVLLNVGTLCSIAVLPVIRTHKQAFAPRIFWHNACSEVNPTGESRWVRK
ncbi:MAG: hypothetical protein R3E95_03485 [Thiolinea sp.]